MIAYIIIAVTAALVLLALSRAIRIVPQARAYPVERLGSYDRTLSAGFNTLVPGIDRVRARIDLREQVVSFAPQPVITEDNLVVHIDTVLYFQVTDPRAATYEIANYLQAIERTLTSREEINGQLRGVLDEATGKWGIRVNRVELKAIDPPKSIIDAMEKQLRAERDKRAAVLTAEGVRQSQILTAEGAKQSAILTAEGQRQSQILMAQGQAKAIDIVFTAIHEGHPDPELLAYQYLQALPKIAEGQGSQVWMIPSEFTKALDGFAAAFGSAAPARPAYDASATAPARPENGVKPAAPLI
jgi:regulator of protease activity HflC (stomatin/prohibitin superfamily)